MSQKKAKKLRRMARQMGIKIGNTQYGQYDTEKMAGTLRNKETGERKIIMARVIVADKNRQSYQQLKTLAHKGEVKI